MFQYLGENTIYRHYSTYGVLTTHVMGLRDFRPETLVVSVKIPNNKEKESRIEIMIQDKETDSRFKPLTGIDIPMGKDGPYKNTTQQELLLAYSVCLGELRSGNVVEDSRLAAIITGEDELAIKAMTS